MWFLDTQVPGGALIWLNIGEMKTSISTLLLQWPDFISNAEKNIWLTKGVIYIPLSMVWIRIFEGSLSFLRSKTLETNGDIFSPWFLHSKIFCLRSNLYIVDKILYVDLMHFLLSLSPLQNINM